MENLAHGVQFEIRTESPQKSPQLVLHHPLLAETIGSEMDVRGVSRKKTSRQYSSRTEMKKSEVVLTNSVLQERVKQRVSGMTPEGRRQFLTQTVKPLLAIHQGLTSKKLTSDAPVDTDSSTSPKTEEHKEVNILVYMTQVFCRSMNMQSEDELLQTMIMQTNQNYLAKQEEGFNGLAKGLTNSDSCKGSARFWGTMAGIAGVGALGTGGVATALGVVAGGVILAAVIFSGGIAIIPAVIGVLGGTMAMGALTLTAIPVALAVVGGYIAYKGYNADGTKDDNGTSRDTPGFGGPPGAAQLTAASTKTGALNTATQILNTTIQTASKRLEDDSSQTNQEGNYVQQAIQDLGNVMGLGR